MAFEFGVSANKDAHEDAINNMKKQLDGSALFAEESDTRTTIKDTMTKLLETYNAVKDAS